jgi:hypothetical protein
MRARFNIFSYAWTLFQSTVEVEFLTIYLFTVPYRKECTMLSRAWLLPYCSHRSAVQSSSAVESRSRRRICTCCYCFLKSLWLLILITSDTLHRYLSRRYIDVFNPTIQFLLVPPVRYLFLDLMLRSNQLLRIRIRRILMFLSVSDPHPDPFSHKYGSKVRILLSLSKNSKKNVDFYCFGTFMTYYL